MHNLSTSLFTVYKTQDTQLLGDVNALLIDHKFIICYHMRLDCKHNKINFISYLVFSLMFFLPVHNKWREV